MVNLHEYGTPRGTHRLGPRNDNAACTVAMYGMCVVPAGALPEPSHRCIVWAYVCDQVKLRSHADAICSYQFVRIASDVPIGPERKGCAPTFTPAEVSACNGTCTPRCGCGATDLSSGSTKTRVDTIGRVPTHCLNIDGFRSPIRRRCHPRPTRTHFQRRYELALRNRSRTMVSR